MTSYLELLDLLQSKLYGCKGWKEMFYLTSHSAHFIYGYMVSDIW